MSVCEARRPGPVPDRAFVIVGFDRAGERPRAVSELVRMKPLAQAIARESGRAFNGTPSSLFACGRAAKLASPGLRNRPRAGEGERTGYAAHPAPRPAGLAEPAQIDPIDLVRACPQRALLPVQSSPWGRPASAGLRGRPCIEPLLWTTSPSLKNLRNASDPHRCKFADLHHGPGIIPASRRMARARMQSGAVKQAT